MEIKTKKGPMTVAEFTMLWMGTKITQDVLDAEGQALRASYERQMQVAKKYGCVLKFLYNTQK